MIRESNSVGIHLIIHFFESKILHPNTMVQDGIDLNTRLSLFNIGKILKTNQENQPNKEQISNGIFRMVKTSGERVSD